MTQTIEPGSFAFVINVGRLTDAASYTIVPGHELRRATPNEIVRIKASLESVGPTPRFQYARLWEQRWPHHSGPVEGAPESEWRYFVIAFEGNNQTLAKIQSAFELTPKELEVGFAVMSVGGGYGTTWTPGRLFHVLENVGQTASFFVDVTAEDVTEVQNIYSQLEEHDPRMMDIQGLLLQLGGLKSLHHSSPLRFLGYFAILESLLTHSPKPSDPYDSITRQVKTKVALLDRRFSRPTDYARFRGASRDKIWTAMYLYRSNVAHGGTPDFSKELRLLVNHESALQLVKETVKAVIRQALNEPQLLLDLKDC